MKVQKAELTEYEKKHIKSMKKKSKYYKTIKGKSIRDGTELLNSLELSCVKLEIMHLVTGDCYSTVKHNFCL